MLPGLNPDPPPSSGFQIVLPVVHGIQPGASVEMCTYTDHILAQDLLVKGSKGFQTHGGHHVILFYTTQPQPPGTTDVCSEQQMTQLRYVSASRGEGSGQGDMLPGNLVVPVPAGAQLVVNHHYLNAGSDPIDAQSAVDVYPAEPGSGTVAAGPVAWVDTSLRAPPGVSSMVVSCSTPNDMPLWLLYPHMHQWGTHATVDRVSPDGSGERLFDVSWIPEYVFDPPMMVRDPSDPYVLHTGDKLQVTCTWNNSTPSDLTFGMEMCVAFGETVGQGGNLACNHGAWAPL